MKHTNDVHAPSDEFIDFLERDTLRIVRREARFAASANAPRSPARTRRFAVGLGVAAGAVVTLGAGMIMGASVSYASAAVPEASRPPLAIRPIGDAINALRCAPSTTASHASRPASAAQQAIPIIELPSPIAKSSIKLGAMLGLKETSDGSVLVEDAGRHQVRLFEPSLATSTVVIDSAPGSARSYGPGNVPRPLIPFMGDSSLFLDVAVPNQMLVLDGHGEIGRALALVAKVDGAGLNFGGTGVDPKGRLLYKNVIGGSMTVTVPYSASLVPPRVRPPGAVSRGDGGAPVDGIIEFVSIRPDSIPIHRIDLAARRVDTVGYVNQPQDRRDENGNGGGKLIAIYGKDGAAIGIKQVINPVRTIDEWAVLADGTIGIVRGHDYHVDWIRPDGTKSSSPKLPFEWKRLTDDEKQRLVDSTRAVLDSVNAWATRRFNHTPAPTDSVAAYDSLVKANGRSNCGTPGLAPVKCPPERRQWPYEIVPLSDIADYLPPFREGAVLADRDGNLWILPRTALSKNGELVYDVVNPKQGLVRRVRLPVGRSIAGFGKGGVVYLQVGDLKNGFTLERTTVPGANKSPTPK